MPTPEVTTGPRPLPATPGRGQQAGTLIVVVEGVCAAVVAAFLMTGSTMVTATVAVTAVGSLAVVRKRD